MTEQGRAGGAAEPPGTPGRRARAIRAAGVVAAAAALGIPTLAASAAGSTPAPLLAAVALGGSGASCGGLPVDLGALPGRPIRDSDRSGPAEGVTQVFRLSEWTRHSPYDGARWSYVTAGPGAAVLVATWPGRATRYIPVRERSDGHWQIDTPCTLESR